MGVIWTDTLLFRPGDIVPKPKALRGFGRGYEETLLMAVAPWWFQASTEEITSNELPLVQPETPFQLGWWPSLSRCLNNANNKTNAPQK